MWQEGKEIWYNECNRTHHASETSATRWDFFVDKLDKSHKNALEIRESANMMLEAYGIIIV